MAEEKDKKKDKEKKPEFLKPKKIEMLTDDGACYQVDRAMQKHDMGEEDVVRIDLGDGTSLVVWASNMAMVCRYRNKVIEDMKNEKRQKEELAKANTTNKQ